MLKKYGYAILKIAVVGQLLDGVLTFWGLQLGFHEGNPIMLWCMNTFGIVPTILVAKSVSTLFAFGMYWNNMHGINMFAIATIYVLAVIPWTLAIGARMLGVL